MNAIDLFAGLGGWTSGATMAGASVVWAANHWQSAVEIHALNHPSTRHVCQDLQQADWSAVPAHDVMLASPCCQGHAKARGKERPQHDASRSTAWAVVSAAEYHRSNAVIVENVPEFRNWKLYPAWRQAMSALGYSMSETLIDAADCGCAQNRVRLIIVATRSKKPFILEQPAKCQQTAASIINFDAGRWSEVHRKGRATATIRRWENGRREHGERFVFSFYGNTRSGRSIERPIGTITTRDRWAVVAGNLMRMLTVDEARAAMSFPAGYVLPSNNRLAMHMLGNAVPPLLAREVVEQIARAA